MQAVYLLNGSIIFDRDPQLTDKSIINLILEDITHGELATIHAATMQVPFEAEDLSLFKYLTFEFKGFDLEEGHNYNLAVHVDVDGSGKITPGDFVSTTPYPVATGLEHHDISLERV